MTSPDPDVTTPATAVPPPQATDAAAAPGGAATAAEGSAPAGQPPRSTHGRGNWRSLVISMIVMTVFVFAWVALQPRPAQKERASVDVARTATQLSEEQRWPLATLAVGDDWHATTAAFRPDESGVPTWLVGYHRRPGDDQYVALTQTRVTDQAQAAALPDWVSRQTKAGREEGETSAGGRTWKRASARVETAGEQRARRSLVSTQGVSPNAVTTVLSGEVEYSTLEAMAARLRETPVQASSPSTAPAGSSSPTP